MNTDYELVSALNRREELIPLYEEYATMLLQTDPVFADSLAQQNYDVEIAHLEEKYAYPKGRITARRCGSSPAGDENLLADLYDL